MATRPNSAMLNLLSEDSDAEDVSTTASVTAARIPADETWENVDGEEAQDEGILIVPPVEVVAPPVPPPPQEPSVATVPTSPLNVSALVSSSVLREVEGLHLSGELLSSIDGDPDRDRTSAASGNGSEANDELVLLPHPRLAIRRSRLLPLVLGALLTSSLVANAVLLHQRASLRLSLLSSRRELLAAKEALEKRKFKAKPEPTAGDPKPPVCRCEEKPKDETKTLVDNCWISAKANVQLGSCVEDARKELSERVDRFSKGLWNFKEHVANLFNQNEGLSSDRPAASSNVMGGVSFQGVRDAATMLMSGVAYAAVATLIAEELDPKDSNPGHEALKMADHSRRSSSNRNP